MSYNTRGKTHDRGTCKMYRITNQQREHGKLNISKALGRDLITKKMKLEL